MAPLNQRLKTVEKLLPHPLFTGISWVLTNYLTQMGPHANFMGL